MCAAHREGDFARAQLPEMEYGADPLVPSASGRFLITV